MTEWHFLCYVKRKIKVEVSKFLFIIRVRFFMSNEKFDVEKFYVIDRLFSELTDMQHELSERNKIKVEYEKEVSHRKRIEEEFHTIQTSLEEQLARREAEKQDILAQLQHEVGERNRIEREYHSVKTSLDEAEAELNRIAEELQHEVGERKRIEKEVLNSKTSLEELIAKSEAESERITTELQSEVQTWKRTVEKLHQSIQQINLITNSVQTTEELR
jgi:chromosome segregation ATPase